MSNAVKYILCMLLMLVCTNAFAVKVEYSTYENARAEYVNITKISCGIKEQAVCEQICGVKTECIKEEGLCTNCAGSNDFFMRLLFTRSTENFSVTDKVLKQSEMIHLLTEQKYILVTYKSVYNFYKVLGSDVVKNDFATFCPKQVEDPILIINLNEKYQPQAVAGIICSDKNGSYVRLAQDKNKKIEVIRLTNKPQTLLR